MQLIIQDMIYEKKMIPGGKSVKKMHTVKSNLTLIWVGVCTSNTFAIFNKIHSDYIKKIQEGGDQKYISCTLKGQT